MCKKCQDTCSTCQDRLANYDRDELYECANCGHLFVEDEVTDLIEGNIYCLDCYEMLTSGSASPN